MFGGVVLVRGLLLVLVIRLLRVLLRRRLRRRLRHLRWHRWLLLLLLLRVLLPHEWRRVRLRLMLRVVLRKARRRPQVGRRGVRRGDVWRGRLVLGRGAGVRFDDDLRVSPCVSGTVGIVVALGAV